MNNTLKTAATSAVLSLGLAFSAQAERINTEGPFTCEGQMFAGDYIAIPHPSFAPITTDVLNLAIGDNIVANIDDSSYFLQITPVNPSTDCDDFMRDLMDTGLFKSVEPNAIVGFDGPSIDIN